MIWPTARLTCARNGGTKYRGYSFQSTSSLSIGRTVRLCGPVNMNNQIVTHRMSTSKAIRTWFDLPVSKESSWVEWLPGMHPDGKTFGPEVISGRRLAHAGDCPVLIAKQRFGEQMLKTECQLIWLEPCPRWLDRGLATDHRRRLFNGSPTQGIGGQHTSGQMIFNAYVKSFTNNDLQSGWIEEGIAEHFALSTTSSQVRTISATFSKNNIDNEEPVFCVDDKRFVGITRRKILVGYD